MTKEEILKKSRSDNAGKDIEDLEVQKTAARVAYFSSFGLCLLVSILNWIFTKQIKNDKRKIWKIWVIFLLRYSTIRFLFEYIRQDSQSEFIWPFTRSQRFFIIFIITWIIIAICLNRHPKENLENKKK